MTAEQAAAAKLPAAKAGIPLQRIHFRLEGAQVSDEVIQRGIFLQGVVDVYPIEPKGTGNYN